MSQVNLLPPEIKERQKIRQRTALAVLGVIALLVLVGAFYFLEQMNLSNAKDELAAQEATNSGLETQIASLEDFGALETELATKEALEASVYAGEVSFSGMLMDVSRVIPPASVLTNLSATVNSGTAEAESTEVATGQIGSISYTGRARDLQTMAMWLTRQEQVKGWANPFSTTMTETGPRTRMYDFTSTVDLTGDALTERGREGAEAAGLLAPEAAA